ncbi:hypothetical protein DJ532_05605 [Sulfolobus sp. A20-N-F8]|uniref:hypothetical protein n=1 Tax=Saccharolobus sp. A20 TaxID=1891280 RepID=UPI0012E9F942|nr:hypothetical protein [Sulfolobus sp. A20]TRM77182.1 hypothetical protein DJ532_05605 [Sulfolobus sp. A20-N-F8]TRM77745.1 hypothetical protein DJ528_06050 [Sulfolobus sp. B5]
MLGKIIVVLIIILIGAFLITHLNLFYHPQITSTKAEEITRTSILRSITMYQFSISTNSTLAYIFPLKLNGTHNVTINIITTKPINLTVLDNSNVVSTTIIHPSEFQKSFLLNGTVEFKFLGEGEVNANVSIQVE